MKRVIVIKRFKDLEHKETIREIGQVLILDEERAKVLAKKGFVEDLVEIDLTTKENSEDSEDKKVDKKATKKK